MYERMIQTLWVWFSPNIRSGGMAYRLDLKVRKAAFYVPFWFGFK
jgi:hypothetical protein